MITQNTKVTHFISGLYLPYECLLPFTLKQPMSGSLRAPSRSASTHSLSLFIAEYGQPNALQRVTKTTVKFTSPNTMKEKMQRYSYNTTYTVSEKIVPPLDCYNFDTHQQIWIF